MRLFLAAFLALTLVGCGTAEVVAPAAARDPDPAPSGPEGGEGGEPEVAVVDARPAPMHQPVPFYEGGTTERDIDAATAREHGYVVIDLGEEWTPYLFTERGSADEEEVPNDYRETYLALARGDFPDNHHGDRARDDRYLELFGIPPTLGLLRTRFRHASGLECASNLDLSPLADFEGFMAYSGRDEARSFARQLRTLERAAGEWMRAQHVDTPEAIDATRLSDREQRRLADYLRILPRARAVRAAQLRLECEGFFEGITTEMTPFAMDWPTHEALASFERRHRIYGWGYLGRDTLDMLRRPVLEGEQEAVIRVIAERAMHAAGVIEDGSVEAHYRGADGEERDVPNLEGQLRTLAIEAFGLTTPESTLAFLESLGDLGADTEHLVAIRGPEMPEYYGPNMELRVEIDRGDVWYEFPYDERGNERAQPVERRPRTTIFAEYAGQHIPLARFGTTIGGWRSELIEDRLWWRYKNSPAGEVVWRQIVASPVWLPPESTPPRDLLRRTGRRGADAYAPNYHETGPSYASAYGLVAAYHTPFITRADGTTRFGADEGIRSHGSVDYNSIMRRHSHGCHRLHNHIAVRLMSFVLAHRAHRRVGQQTLGFRRDLVVDGHSYNLAIDRGGYVFELVEPLHVRVLEGRIRGDRSSPITAPLPRWDSDRGAYMLPDGGAVAIDRMGSMRSIPTPIPDAGLVLPVIPVTPIATAGAAPAVPGGLPNAPLPLPPAIPAPAPR